MKTAVTPAKVPVLVVSPYPDDHVQLGKILQPERWDLRHAITCEQAQANLQRMPFSVVITESEGAGGLCWRKVFSIIGKLPFETKPQLVVISNKADDRLWSEVLNMGGYNVLAKPFEPSEVAWVLEAARFEPRRLPELVGQERQRLSA